MLDPQTEMILIGVGKGLVYGGIAGGIGYIKNETWETFDPYKFVRTMIIGACVGGIVGAGYGDLSSVSDMIGGEIGIPGPVVEGFIMTSIVALADNVVKILARRTDLGKLWSVIKNFFGKRL